jgi:hypothetical protein
MLYAYHLLFQKKALPAQDPQIILLGAGKINESDPESGQGTGFTPGLNPADLH